MTPDTVREEPRVIARVNNVSHAYKKAVALDGVSLEFARGRVFLGPVPIGPAPVLRLR